MDNENRKQKSKIFALALLIVFISGIAVYVHDEEQNRIHQQQIQAAKEKELNAAKEIERLKTEKEAMEKQRQEEEAKRQADKAAEEARRIREKYLNYHNKTFDFSIDLPKWFKVEANNEKGVILSSPDKQGKIAVVATHKTDNETNRQMYEEQLASAQNAGGDITYSVCGDDWYVVSWAIKGDGNYIKKLTNRDSEIIYVVMFPMSQQAEYTPIIEHMEDTFHRGKML